MQGEGSRQATLPCLAWEGEARRDLGEGGGGIRIQCRVLEVRLLDARLGGMHSAKVIICPLRLQSAGCLLDSHWPEALPPPHSRRIMGARIHHPLTHAPSICAVKEQELVGDGGRGAESFANPGGMSNPADLTVSTGRCCAWLLALVPCLADGLPTGTLQWCHRQLPGTSRTDLPFTRTSLVPCS